MPESLNFTDMIRKKDNHVELPKQITEDINFTHTWSNDQTWSFPASEAFHFLVPSMYVLPCSSIHWLGTIESAIGPTIQSARAIRWENVFP